MVDQEPYLISPDKCRLKCHTDGSVCGHINKCSHKKQIDSIASRRTQNINKRSDIYGIPKIAKDDVKKLIEDSIANGFLCCYCNEILTINAKKSDFRMAVSIDHIVPLSDGGTNESSNLAISCTRCNLVKGTMKSGHFKLFLQTLRENGGRKEMLSWLDDAYKHAQAYKIERSEVEGSR